MMAKQAVKHKLYYAGVVFLKRLLRSDELKQKGFVYFKYLWNTTITSSDVKQKLASAINLHDHTLIKFGQYGVVHRCNNKTVQKKLQEIPQTSNVSILDRRTLNKYHLRNARNEGNSTVELTTATTLQGDKLCNGGQIRVINTIKWIIGIYVDSNHSIDRIICV